ncbi:MAG: hypothetical protein VXZ82_06640, partial [Planctomycetota bacterium]|nr:hypothetical protein [Planctomycetota bacterium]
KLQCEAETGFVSIKSGKLRKSENVTKRTKGPVPIVTRKQRRCPELDGCEGLLGTAKNVNDCGRAEGERGLY